MASPWDALTTPVQISKQIANLQNEIEWSIDKFGDQPLPANTAKWLRFDRMVRFWAKHADTILNEAPHGVALSDLLFVLICYTYAVQSKLLKKTQEKSSSIDIYETVCKLQQLCMSLPDKPDTSLQDVFEDCVSLVIWRINDAAHEETKKPRGLGMDYGDPQDEVTGDEQKMLDDLEAAKAKEEASTRAKLFDALLPWCTRTFFEAWHAELLVNEFKAQEQLSDALQERIQAATTKFDKWMQNQKWTDLPTDFHKKLHAWTFRQLVCVGALRNLHRQPHMRERKGDGEWTRLFNEDRTQTQQPHELWLRKQEPLDIFKDAKHPLRDILHLTMFATIFDCNIGTPGAFTEPHVVFRDELLAKAQYIREDTVELLPRPPLLVQTGAGQWRIHHEQMWYPVAPMRDNLLLWCALMEADHGCNLLSGKDITEWVKTFV